MRYSLQQTARRYGAGNRSALMEKVSVSSTVFRSIALFAILFQIRLIATDLADTSVFVFTLLAGFAAATYLSILRPNGKPVNPAAAIISIALIPWVCRAFIAAPRLFIPNSTGNPAIILDSLLLNLDRNNFVSLFPYYWSAVSTWFSLRPTSEGRKFLRAAVIADAALLLFIYSAAHTARIELYRWPIVMIALFAAVVFFQALSLLFSMPPETKLRVKEICFSTAALLAIIVTGGFLFLKPFQEQAVEMGGGLLEPKLFSFDFSKYLRLDPEISMKNDLVLIVKKDNDNNILLRRSVLSGYSRRQGFYKIEELDEKTHPQRLSGRQIHFIQPEFKAARLSTQEYFLVNFSASAFIGMKEPVTVSPYENWNASSFNSAYSVESLVSDANYWDLIWSTVTGEHPGPEQLGLSESEYKIYTEYGNDERLRFLAERITDGIDHYVDKVFAINNFLKYGEYRYSLKPGIAPDGDQLGWFLFESKKGYCSYYAFSFALLLRSLGIPARVAAGFFVDPQTNTFDYYPIRSDMAHAWVEVPFPGFGWIEFDPTTEITAEDEEFQFLSADPLLFEKLMKEILENRSRMRIIETDDRQASPSSLGALTHNAVVLLQNNWLLILATALTILFLSIRCGYFFSVFITRDFRKKSIRLMKHACRRLRLAGLRRNNSLAESEWALHLDDQYNGIYSMYQSSAAARFAPEYSKADFDIQWTNYKNFRVSYNRKVPLLRRVISWVLPPLAFMLNQKKEKIKTLLLIFFIAFIAGSQTRAQDGDEFVLPSADELYNEASDADFSENWEHAIELYREGSTRFPEDIRFPWSLGNLYYSRSLFGLAWDEYRKTEEVAPDNPAILIRLARTAGYLNRDSLSVDYYERALRLEPDDKEAIGSLGWMYFKVHRLTDGEKLLVSALERFGDDPDFCMTLGTVYSDMYRYYDSKYWYNKAIAMGEEIDDRVFTAIAWYNLSILEARFYRFDLCMDATNSSINYQNRASGRIARGELFKKQMELEKAQGEYEAAYQSDISPLAKLYLAQIYQISGRLEEARLYAEDCLKGSDNSWMLNFGIDPDRYKRDIHQILANTYSGLVKTERFSPWAQPLEKIHSLFRTISFKLKYEVNIRLYRKYSLAAANAYLGKISNEGGPHLDSFLQYYNAFEDYPRRALSYLNKARAFETGLIPDAIPFYNIEEGILLGDENLVEKALYGLDAQWERELIAKCYGEFANPKNSLPLSPRRQNPERSAEELFALNRGALRQAGIKLPVRFNVVFNMDALSSNRKLEKALSAAGFRNTPEARFLLTVRIDGTRNGGYSASCELIDRMGEIDSIRYFFPLSAGRRADYYNLARTLGNIVFTVE
jgi:tetratricopeptide (TPR) repeat protein